MLKLKLFTLLLLLAVNITFAQYPGENWEQYASPEEAGFSTEMIEKAKSEFYDSTYAAFLVVYDGKVLLSWGDVERRYKCHSVRKSYMSALFGIYAHEGTVDVNETIESLGIEDKDTLTKAEKQARIIDLLQSRSGIYHPAAYETMKMKEKRPARGTYGPGENWYYNNWDFNTLCEIIERKSETDIFEAFMEKLAKPLQMQDYRVMDGYKCYEKDLSLFPAYPFKMSARDMARFGVLYLNDGKWNDKQIISKEWILKTQEPFSSANKTRGYSLMWWISKDLVEYGVYFASGVGGQKIYVIPKMNMVIVQRANTYQGQKVSGKKSIALLKSIVEAKIEERNVTPEIIPLKTNHISVKSVELSEQKMKLFQGTVLRNEKRYQIVYSNQQLIAIQEGGRSFAVVPVSVNRLFVEDIEFYIDFVKEENGLLKGKAVGGLDK